jgi:hypothetical protein
MKPFRFGVNVGRARSRAEWADKARKIESLGYDILTVPDHLADFLAPTPALVSAAEATKNLRNTVGSGATRLCFEHLPGRWEIPVAWYNKPSLSFWRMVIPAVINGTVKEYAGDGEWWGGTVLCFGHRVRES